MPNGDRLNIPMGSYLPPEMGAEMFEHLESFRQRQEQEQTRRFLEGINALGRLHTGSALRGAIQQVLGPGIERRERLMGDIALKGAELGREERLGEVDFGRRMEELGSRQTFQERMARFAQQQAMARLREQLGAQREMAEMQRGGRGFFEQIGQAMIPGIADLATSGLGTGLGGLPALAGGLFG